MGTKKSNIPIGFDQLYYAVMTDEINETYDPPVRLPGAISLSLAPNIDDAKLPADDVVYEATKNITFYDVEMGIAELDTADRAAILGHAIDSTGGLAIKTTDIAPYVALLYRRRMANGKYRYAIIYKIRFAPSDEDIETKGESITYQTPVLTGTALQLESNALSQFSVTEGDPGVETSFLSSFFDSVYKPDADTTAPTITSTVPAADATGVAVTSDVTITFSKALRATTINDANFMLLDDTLSPVAVTITVDADNKVVTLDPASDLTATTTYSIIVTTGVKDLAGNALAATSVTTFTTA